MPGRGLGPPRPWRFRRRIRLRFVARFVEPYRPRHTEPGPVLDVPAVALRLHAPATEHRMQHAADLHDSTIKIGAAPMADLPDIPPPGAPSEPLLTVGTITAAVTAILGVLTAWGVHLTDDQRSAILATLAVVAPIVVAVWGRRLVWAPRTVRLVVKATQGGVASEKARLNDMLKPDDDR